MFKVLDSLVDKTSCTFIYIHISAIFEDGVFRCEDKIVLLLTFNDVHISDVL